MLYIRSEERRRPRASFWHYELRKSEVYAVFMALQISGLLEMVWKALSAFYCLSLSLPRSLASEILLLESHATYVLRFAVKQHK